MSSFERNTILSHLPGTLKVFGDLPVLIHFFLIISHFSFLAAPNLHVSPKTEIYLDFSIKSRGRNMRPRSFCIQFLQYSFN